MGGLIGAAQAVAILATSPMVGDARYSYPFDAGWYAVAQASFAVQHLLVLVGLLALIRLSPPTRLARGGLWTAIAGMALLALMEILAISAARAATDSSLASTLNALYSVPMLLLGIGLIAGGVGVARSTMLPGRTRWIPLALGVYVFVPLFPSVFGPLAAGRIAIGGWMLIWAGLGWALVQAARSEHV